MTGDHVAALIIVTFGVVCGVIGGLGIGAAIFGHMTATDTVLAFTIFAVLPLMAWVAVCLWRGP